MSTIIDKSLILNRIKTHLGFTKESDFARFLGIKPQTLSTWHSRNTFDIELLYAKCEFIDANWLITGQGSMLKNLESSNFVNKNLTAEEPSENYDSEYWKNEYIAVLKECREIEKKYRDVLEGKLHEVFIADKSNKAG